MISHRLSTLGHVDEIVVLQDGRIAERGTYAQLTSRNGVFARLLAEQHWYTSQPAESAPPAIRIPASLAGHDLSDPRRPAHRIGLR